ncbi:MAG: cytochrome c [Gammaproteobacteria bacterium]|nr:cytochrome c [Gammaproteobacteria bacterium]MDH5803014.1 cytochrome c [Gammaproteobacteria bacterium]
MKKALVYYIFLIGGLFVGLSHAAETKAPTVPFQFAVGKTKFQEQCSLCHGKWGDGSKHGPPLMHAFYKPSHHSDAAFYRAARKGVKAHHWEFGDMPPIPSVTTRDMEQIIQFVRWLQKERGIF